MILPATVLVMAGLVPTQPVLPCPSHTQAEQGRRAAEDEDTPPHSGFSARRKHVPSHPAPICVPMETALPTYLPNRSHANGSCMLALASESLEGRHQEAGTRRAEHIKGRTPPSCRSHTQSGATKTPHPPPSSPLRRPGSSLVSSPAARFFSPKDLGRQAGPQRATPAPLPPPPARSVQHLLTCTPLPAAGCWPAMAGTWATVGRRPTVALRPLLPLLVLAMAAGVREAVPPPPAALPVLFQKGRWKTCGTPPAQHAERAVPLFACSADPHPSQPAPPPPPSPPCSLISRAVLHAEGVIAAPLLRDGLVGAHADVRPGGVLAGAEQQLWGGSGDPRGSGSSWPRPDRPDDDGAWAPVHTHTCMVVQVGSRVQVPTQVAGSIAFSARISDVLCVHVRIRHPRQPASKPTHMTPVLLLVLRRRCRNGVALAAAGAMIGQGLLLASARGCQPAEA